MFTLLLIIIYLAFISLGLPDSLLGSAWPVMHADLSLELSTAGVISMVISGGTIISSLFSERVIKRIGTGKVTLISVSMTAIALFGFSFGNSFIPSVVWLCIMAIPLGLGAGSVDAALNNFVALHYKASHMSWLHCFWGVGATLGPIIMSFFIKQNNQWRNGYFVIAGMQSGLVCILLLALPLWKKVETRKQAQEIMIESNGQKKVFRIPGVKLALVSFFCYCAAETTTGLWGSSYLVEHKGIMPETAARWIAFFYAGITVGRFLTGFLTMRWKSSILIRIGVIICFSGIFLLLLPLPVYFCMCGFVLIGLGCAPIFPCMLHETPHRFGTETSQSIMGLQMAFAYIGSTFMPMLLGKIAEKTGLVIFPYFLIIFVLIMLVATEKMNELMRKR